MEYDHIKYLPSTWTIVHEIDADSPLFNLTNQEIMELDAEWYILIEYHDDTFSQRVYQIHSYKTNELKMDVKFVPSTTINKEGFTVLDHESLGIVHTMND